MATKRVWAAVSMAAVLLVAWGGAGSAGAAHAAGKQVAGLAAFHRGGQTFLTWREVDTPLAGEAIDAKELRGLLRKLDAKAKVRYRVYRGEKPIRSVKGRKPVAEVGPLSCWNPDYFGIYPKPGQKAPRYIIKEGAKPLAPGTGLCVHNPAKAGKAYYAVTRSVGGKEDTALGEGNSLSAPVTETVDDGVPVLQRVEKPKRFQYVKSPTLRYYVRWEAPPRCAAAGKAYDYLVAEPPKLADPAPVGIHLHCWGGSLNGGYGWWYNAEKGDLLLASNQIPYDWWTGYHEQYFAGPPTKAAWVKGVVRPYSTTRMLAFLDWMTTKWKVDLSRTHVAGNSMGGSGAPMFAIRYGERIAWGVGWVGVHIPAETPHFRGSYERVYGKLAWGVKFQGGTSVWDHYSDAWWLRTYPARETGFVTFSNGKNDGGIGWSQAVKFWQALQDTKRPHVFVWGQSGHGQRARMPVTLGQRVLEIDIRTDATLPAFSRCSLDDKPGRGDPKDGDPKGQSNLYLAWATKGAVDRVDRWEMTVRLIDKAPKAECTVDITPRRCQKFRPKPGATLRWSARPSRGGAAQQGSAAADAHGLVTLTGVRVPTGGVRVRITSE